MIGDFYFVGDYTNSSATFGFFNGTGWEVFLTKTNYTSLSCFNANEKLSVYMYDRKAGESFWMSRECRPYFPSEWKKATFTSPHPASSLSPLLGTNYTLLLYSSDEYSAVHAIDLNFDSDEFILFNLTVNGDCSGISGFNTTVFVSGNFSCVINGSTFNNILRYDLKSMKTNDGQFIRIPGIIGNDSVVNSMWIDLTDQTLYVGGRFCRIGGEDGYKNIAAYDIQSASWNISINVNLKKFSPLPFESVSQIVKGSKSESTLYFSNFVEGSSHKRLVAQQGSSPFTVLDDDCEALSLFLFEEDLFTFVLLLVIATGGGVIVVLIATLFVCIYRSCKSKKAFRYIEIPVMIPHCICDVICKLI